MIIQFRPRAGKRRGFSMPEMLVTLLLIGILVAIAGPKVSGMFRVDQVKRSLDRLAGDVSFARMRAIRSGRPVDVRSTSTTRYVVVASTATGVDTLRKVNLASDYPGVTISTFAFTFDGRGVLRNAADLTAVTATRGTLNANLRVTRVGMVYRDY
jgi:prepilin-type N-terminal cleavage/methylation domain-containing protein